jgi:DNA-binding CsgD family transcriptional regulator
VANTTGALSRLKETGLTPSEIAVRLWISLASVYRILAE